MPTKGAALVRQGPLRPAVFELPPLMGVSLPSPHEEALKLLEDINARDDRAVAFIQQLIDVTPRQQAILLWLTDDDPPARCLVNKMLRFRVQVRAQFDALVTVARRADG